MFKHLIVGLFSLLVTYVYADQGPTMNTTAVSNPCCANNVAVGDVSKEVSRNGTHFLLRKEAITAHLKVAIPVNKEVRLYRLREEGNSAPKLIKRLFGVKGVYSVRVDNGGYTMVIFYSQAYTAEEILTKLTPVIPNQ